MAVSACLINDVLEQDTDLWHALHVTLDSPAEGRTSQSLKAGSSSHWCLNFWEYFFFPEDELLP
jgi:hypothetical protein